jgi:putative intracellular protease/amidase
VAVSCLLCESEPSHPCGRSYESFADPACNSCHGPAIFADLFDPETGKPIVQGKKIMGFTTQAEIDMGVIDGLRAWKEPMIDEHAEALGAKCMSSEILQNASFSSHANTYDTDVRVEGVWDDYHVVDGRLVTGMNPQSAKSTAKAVVEQFEAL